MQPLKKIVWEEEIVFESEESYRENSQHFPARPFAQDDIQIMTMEIDN